MGLVESLSYLPYTIEYSHLVTRFAKMLDIQKVQFCTSAEADADVVDGVTNL